MINAKLKLAIVSGFVSAGILIYLSISAFFLVLILGLLFIPPTLILASMSIEGAPMILKEFQGIMISGKQFFVISMSREAITLEPQFR